MVHKRQADAPSDDDSAAAVQAAAAAGPVEQELKAHVNVFLVWDWFERLEIATGFTWSDSEELATVLDPFQTIFMIWGATV